MPRKGRTSIGARGKGKKGKMQGTSRQVTSLAVSPVTAPARAAAVAATAAMEEILLELEEPDELHGIISEADRHVSWGVFYAEVLGSPPKNEWMKQGGTVSFMQKALNIPIGSSRSVVNVLTDFCQCHKLKIAYTGGRKVVPRAQAEIDCFPVHLRRFRPNLTPG